MRTGFNILWFIFGGAIAALAWYLAALLMAVSIIGLPWARAAWEIGSMTLHPFGRELVSIDALRGRADPFAGLIGFFANLLWLPLGLVIAVIHLVHGVALVVTIIGIPFALQHFKLAGASLAPVRKRVVLTQIADAARMQDGFTRLGAFRR